MFANIQLCIGNNPFIRPMAFSLQQANDAIKDYCGQDLTLDPNAPASSGFSQFITPGMSYDNFYPNDGGSLLIRMNATFPADQFGCAPKKAFSTEGAECVRKLTGLINSCDTQSITAKNGGILVDYTDHGCVQWSIFGQT